MFCNPKDENSAWQAGSRSFEIAESEELVHGARLHKPFSQLSMGWTKEELEATAEARDVMPLGLRHAALESVSRVVKAPSH